jgi:5-methylthioadenosine/S-adenosylhomocysteine deaminase
MTSSILIHNGTIITMDPMSSIVRGNLFIENGKISAIGQDTPSADINIDARSGAVLPGFVQTHLHLCQTLFRGSADDLALIDWLKQRVWPMEAAHTPVSIRASAQLAVAELVKGGTTSALTMETVNHTEDVFRVVEESGFRATVGKCMMDKGEDVPAALQEKTEESIEESIGLMERWHNFAGGRIRYCFAPRFAISCTKELLSRVAELATTHKVMIHTHASENTTECAIVEAETGQPNVLYLNSLGISGRNVALAHCVHLSDEEIVLLSETETNVVHCPSSNLKLGSGIARIKEMLERGVAVSIGADGAACNNRLDMFTEMRTAALLQKAIHGPESLPASTVLRMATLGGAWATGLADQIGSLEIGKLADVIVVRLDQLHCTPGNFDPVSAVVYAAEASDVETVIIDGRVVMEGRRLTTMDEQAVLEEANYQAELLHQRAGLA